MSYILKLVNCKDDSVNLDNQVVEIIQQLESYKDITDMPTGKFKDVLRPYQLDGFRWLRTLSKFGFFIILTFISNLNFFRTGHFLNSFSKISFFE
jgi:SNF2 family DNA or RNA helicase